MPKKPPKNAFFYYMLHFKGEEGRRGRHYDGLPDVSVAASESWQKMTAQERGPFEKKAKDAKCPNKEVEKYTSQGIAVSVIQKEQDQLQQEQRTMMRTIKSGIVEAFNDNTIASQEFFFISGIYFTNRNEQYLPAEIAMVKFSFESGIISKFHTFVGPEEVPYGYKGDAKEHSEKTHRLPIPPESKGDSDFKRILYEMNSFMGEPTPVLFTSKENIPMIKSFIESFIDFGGNDHIERYRVYPLHQLFFEIKEMAVKNSVNEQKSFKSIHIAEERLRSDDYAYLSGTACGYHDELDCAKHCALVHVQNWAYIFMDYICVDLNVELISGQHFPPEIDISQVAADATRSDFSISKLNDTQMNETTDTTERTFIDEGQTSRSVTASDVATSHWSARPKSRESVPGNEHFPTLGSRNRKPCTALKRSNQYSIENPRNKPSSSSSSSSNPWHQRRDFESDSDEAPSFTSDMNSSYSRGMGRGSALFRCELGFGRGRSHK